MQLSIQWKNIYSFFFNYHFKLIALTNSLLLLKIVWFGNGNFYFIECSYKLLIYAYWLRKLKVIIIKNMKKPFFVQIHRFLTETIYCLDSIWFKYILLTITFQIGSSLSILNLIIFNSQFSLFSFLHHKFWKLFKRFILFFF